MNNANQGRWVLGGAVIGVVAALYAFPLVRVAKVDVAKDADEDAPPEGVDIELHADLLWEELVRVGDNRAPQLTRVLADYASDEDQARTTHGRQSRLGGPFLFLASGQGRVVGVDEKWCEVALEGGDQRVALRLGPLVGNSLRDVLGSIDANDFASSRDFNKVSTMLNQRAVSDAIEPARKRLAVGYRVRFIGCGQFGREGPSGAWPLSPVKIEVINPAATP